MSSATNFDYMNPGTYMKPSRHALYAFIPLAIGGCLLLAACHSARRGIEVAQPIEAKPKSATAHARKSLALVYVKKAEEQLAQITDPEAKRKAGLAIAETYALLDEPQTGRRFLPPMPPRPNDPASHDDFLEYIAVLAALGEYEKLEGAIDAVHAPAEKDLIRSYVVYYDALLQRGNLPTSLNAAATELQDNPSPHILFYLALGYQQTGHSEKARQTCLMPKAPLARLLTCAYMAATMGMAGEEDETAFYIDEATDALANTPDAPSVDAYTLMLYGRALVFAGRFEEATDIYAELGNKIDGIYLGSVLAKRLRYSGNPSIAKSVVRNIESRIARYEAEARQLDYLYNCEGDFLASLEMFNEFNGQLRRITDPQHKIQLLLGGAQALADAYLYDSWAN